MSEEEEKPFTVSDRRHFTPEGSVRDVGTTTQTLDSGISEETPLTEGASDAVEIGFAGFLMSLGAQAGALLEAAGRKDGDAAEALRGARSIISILEMLQDKTEGRRTDAEDRILDGVLYELRLGYVGAARAVEG
jgi:hypothetical protein